MLATQVPPLGPWALSFGVFVLLPFIGVLSLTRRKLAPALGLALVVWLALGAAAFVAGPPARLLGASGNSGFWLRWNLGLFLCAAFLLVARMRESRRTGRWLKLVLAGLAVAAFARGLVQFLERAA